MPHGAVAVGALLVQPVRAHGGSGQSLHRVAVHTLSGGGREGGREGGDYLNNYRELPPLYIHVCSGLWTREEVNSTSKSCDFKHKLLKHNTTQAH